MSGTEHSGTGKGRGRLALEIFGALILVFQLLVYWRQTNIYSDQLAAMHDANDKTQQALDSAVKDRRADNEQHVKERKEDLERLAALDRNAANANQRANDFNQRFNDLKRKTEDVRNQLTTMISRFVQGFDEAVTTAYKVSGDKVNLEQLKGLGQGILAQRKAIRDTSILVQGNMSTVYMAVDSVIDALETELNSPTPNSARIRELFRMIFDSRAATENRVINAAETSLNALGCSGNVLASRLSD